MRSLLASKRLPLLLAFCFATFHLSFAQKKLIKKIPSSSNMVFVVNGKRIADKVDFDQIRALEFYQDLDEQAAANLKEKYEYISYLYKDPRKAGINLEKNIVMSFDFAGNMDADALFLVPLSSKSKFKKFLKNTMDSTDLAKEKTVGGVTYFRDGSMMYGYTGQYFFVTDVPSLADLSRNEAAEIKAKELKKSKKKNSVLANENFTVFLKDEYDAAYWINTGTFINDLYTPLLTSALSDLDTAFLKKEFYQDSYMHFLVNFNNGDITYQTKQFLNPLISADLDKVYACKFNEEILNYFRKGNLLGSVSYSVNVPELKNYWEKNFSSLEQMIKDEAYKKIYEESIENDSIVKQLDQELDSLNTEIFNLEMAQYNYDYDYDYDYDDDYDYSDEVEEEAVYEEYEEYEQYDTTEAVEGYEEYEYEEVEPAVETEEVEPVIEEEPAYEEADEVEYVEDDYAVEEIAVDTVAVYNAEYEDTYTPSEEDLKLDSLKTLRDNKQEEIQKRKDELVEEKAAAFPYNEEELWSIFEGDIIAAVTDVRYEEKAYTTYEYDEETEEMKEVENSRREPMPIFIIASTINNTEIANQILSKIEGKGLIKKENNYYLVIPGNNKMYITLKDNVLLFTNDDALIADGFEGFSQSEQLETEVRSLILDNNFSSYVDFKQITARVPRETFNNDKSYAMFTNIMNLFQNISATDAYAGESVTSGKVQINLTNKIDNSIFEIFRVINLVYLETRSQF